MRLPTSSCPGEDPGIQGNKFCASGPWIAGSSPAMRRTGDSLNKPLPDANSKTDLQRATEQFELWRLCRKSQCRRARACRGEARACCEMLTDWSEALSLKDKRVNFVEAIERLRDESARE